MHSIEIGCNFGSCILCRLYEYVIDCAFLVNSNEQKQTIFSAHFPYHILFKSNRCFEIVACLLMLQTSYCEAAEVMIDSLLEQCCNIKLEVEGLQKTDMVSARGQ